MSFECKRAIVARLSFHSSTFSSFLLRSELTRVKTSCSREPAVGIESFMALTTRERVEPLTFDPSLFSGRRARLPLARVCETTSVEESIRISEKSKTDNFIRLYLGRLTCLRHVWRSDHHRSRRQLLFD